MNKVVCILGPTASGKSRLGIALAKRMKTEIISGDAFQIYKGMDIGTAKVSAGEQMEVRHHMIDILDPTEPFDAMQFKRRADPLIDELNAQGKIPLVVGGTGFYVQTLLYGLDYEVGKVPEIRQKWESYLTNYGKESLYRQLQRCDSKTAERLSENDTKRVIRALEIFEATGVKMSETTSTQKSTVRDTYIFEP